MCEIPIVSFIWEELKNLTSLVINLKKEDKTELSNLELFENDFEKIQIEVQENEERILLVTDTIDDNELVKRIDELRNIEPMICKKERKQFVQNLRQFYEDIRRFRRDSKEDCFNTNSIIMSYKKCLGSFNEIKRKEKKKCNNTKSNQ